MEAMKATWTKSLQGLQPNQLRDALDYCADHESYPPSLPRFREICDQFKSREIHKKALPRKFTEEELARNQQRVQAAVSSLEPKRDMKAWAKLILSTNVNPSTGKPWHFLAVKMAQEAMRMEVDVTA